MNHEYKIASVSWPDHLVFGEGDGKLDAVEGLERRMKAWRDEVGTMTIQWREVRTRVRLSHYYATPENPRTQERKINSVEWDDFDVVPRLAHDLGMSAQLYVSVMDDGRPLPSDEERARSYHNAMHGQHVTWQTDWSRDNPRFAVENRDGSLHQWGVLCYGYPEVREHMIRRIVGLLGSYEFDGVFVCLRSQCRPADFADEYGFNDPVRADFLQAHGKDIRAEDFDLPSWRSLQGGYFTEFLRGLKRELGRRTLSIGVPRGGIIGPPIGNWDLEWAKWVRDSIVDEIVVDQNSSQCPSMWHSLWPMHRGYGYLQNYIDGKGLLPLERDLEETYAPVLTGSAARLYAARQWDAPDEETERRLLSLDGVSGMVFSSFRYDNPGAVRRGDFRA
jgi:hypothetical protein